MKRRPLILVALLAAALTSACATTSSGGGSSAGQAHATYPVHQALRVCPGSGASNAGPVRNGWAVAYTPWIDTRAGLLLRNPTEGACLSSGFGWRSRASGGSRNHRGIDLADHIGGAIFAAGDGRVVSAGWLRGYGRTLVIDHGNGVQTLYAHLETLAAVSYEGAYVHRGQVIGMMGRTGNATGTHLHYEVRVRGQAVDALTYRPSQG